MGEYWDRNRLIDEWLARGLSRRDLMRLLGAGAGAAAVGAIAGLRPGTADAQASTPVAQGGQVSVLWVAPVTFNPLFSTSGSEQQVERAMFGALVKMSNALVPTPDLAKTIDVSSDGLTYTFTLHDGITFSDGTPLTSADVLFTLERAINPKTGSIWKGRLSGIAGAAKYDGTSGTVAGLAAPDDHTVKITLSAPNAAFLVTLCNFSGLGILPSHTLKDIPPDQLQKNGFSLNPTPSAGAFKFGQFKTDQYAELDRNDKYFGTAALDKVFMQILTPEVGLAQLQTGELTLMTLPVAEVERVKTLPGVTVVSVPSPSMSFLAVNLTRPYLQNAQVRQAMMYAIDRQGIVKQVYQAQGEVVNSPIFGPDWMGVPTGLNDYAYNPDKAKQLLDASGFDKSQKLEIMNVPGTPENDAAIVIIQQQLQQVGFKIDILQVDVNELITRYIQTTNFDLFLNGGGVFRADPSVSATYFTTANFTPNGGNGSHYSNPQIDTLFAQGQAETDKTKRKGIYTQIAQILNTDVPWIYLWSPNSNFGLSTKLHGFKAPSYVDNKLWNVEEWSVES